MTLASSGPRGSRGTGIYDDPPEPSRARVTYADATRASISAGTGTTQADASSVPRATASRQRAWRVKPEVHRLDRVAERPRTGEVDHVAMGQDMDGLAVAEAEGRDAVGDLIDGRDGRIGDEGRSRRAPRAGGRH